MTCFQYRDPLIGVLDYIAEVGFPRLLSVPVGVTQPLLKQKCPETTIAIAHESDLQNVEEVVCRLSPKSK
jgi:hypothetical protein